MVEIKAADESYIPMDCLHEGPIDPQAAPTRGDIWQDAPDLPPHPWTDEIIAQVAKKYRCISEGWRGDPPREFMREMIRRYGSCAMLAWEEAKIVGMLRFYPLEIAQLLAREAPGKQPIPSQGGCLLFEPQPKTLWVQCVMTTRPYFASAASKSLSLQTPGDGPDVMTGPSGQRRFRTAEEAGARRGIGQKLVHGLIEWARVHGWQRIVKTAHADLDYMYGEYGGGGKAFWQKAGFSVISTHRQPTPEDDHWRSIVESQAAEKGMSPDEAWTWHRMAFELA